MTSWPGVYRDGSRFAGGSDRVEIEPDYRVVDLASALEDGGGRSAEERSVLEEAHARITGRVDGGDVGGQDAFQLVEWGCPACSGPPGRLLVFPSARGIGAVSLMPFRRP